MKRAEDDPDFGFYGHGVYSSVMTWDQGNERPLPKTTIALFHGRLGLRQFPSAKAAMTQLAPSRHPHGL